MVRDGETGWIARSCGSADLADAMRRALSTDGPTCAAMGRRAAESIRRLCDNRAVTAQHIALRRALTTAGPSRSYDVRTVLRGRHFSSSDPGPLIADPARRVAIVIDAMDDTDALEAAVAAVLEQEMDCADCAIIVDQCAPPTPALQAAEARGWRVVAAGRSTRLLALREAAIALAASSAVVGVALLPSTITLFPDFTRTTAATLEACPSAGAVSPWVGGLPATVGPCPSFPYAWVVDEVSPATVFRREAFLQARWFGEETGVALLNWAISVAIMADGWTVVTVPAVLASARPSPVTDRLASPREVDARRRVRAFYAPLVAQHSEDSSACLRRVAFPAMTRGRGFSRATTAIGGG